MQQPEYQNNSSTEQAPKKKSFRQEALAFLRDFAITAVCVLLVCTFLIQPVRVSGDSMCDTLKNGEIMLVTKPEYLFGDPDFGDVVICRYPGRGLTYFVKRVMGLPGDTIEIRDNVVYRNGEPLEESYLTPERNDNGFDMLPFTLGKGDYFVMGDNRDYSHDSRNYHSDGRPSAITRSMILGHVRWVVLPTIRTIE